MADGHLRHPLFEFTRARVLEFVREPGAIFWVFLFPVGLAIALGIAFRERPPEPYRVGVLADAPEATRTLEILTALDGVVATGVTAEEGAVGLRNGRFDVLVQTRGLVEDGAPDVTYRYDPARPESRAARLGVDDALQRRLGRRDVASIQEDHVVDAGGRYIDFLIPGLIGLNVMGSSMWGIGYTVVLARRRRLLRRLAVTPMRRPYFLLSYMFSRLLFLLPEVALLVLFAWVVFDVSVSGSYLALTATTLLGALCFIGIALLVAARTDSTEVASGWMNAVQLPMWIASGSFFSHERFPEIFQPLIKVLPLTAFNDALRAIMMDGAPLWRSWPQLLILAVWGVVASALALRWFRWQ